MTKRPPGIGAAAPAAALLLLASMAGGCPAPAVVTVEIGEAFDPASAFSALPASGGVLELRQGLQGAVMLTPAMRVTGVSGATSGRLELRISAGGSEIASENIPLTDLAVGPDGASYDYGEFAPLQDDQIATYLGLEAVVSVAVVGGGFDGYAEVTVTMVDEMTDF